jgi:PKD repeat protein
MKLYRTLLLPIMLVNGILAAKAQVSDTAAAEINPSIENNKVKFGSALRPLRQVAGAPASFYSYFWEFGDGSYSFEKEPEHVYSDTGTYDVRLYATNNYDDGKKPGTRPRRVKVRSKTMLAANKQPAFFSGTGSLEMRTNQMAKPGDDMVLLIGYRNAPGNAAPVSGSIMLLYNEKQFSSNSFDIGDVRSYHRERQISFDSLMALSPARYDLYPGNEPGKSGWFTAGPAEAPETPDRQQLLQLLKKEMSLFRKNNIWRISDVQKGEEKFLFVSLNTLPEMIKDTNAVVTLTALFIPDDPSLETEKYDLELQVVASHDPNKMMLKNHKLNYRFTGKNKDIVYKVRFQNTGKGPAKKVAVTVYLPGVMQATTVDLVDMKPKCNWCDSAYENQSCIDTLITNDSIQFVFKNIYLPGMQQEGVSDPDSTMGFIRYKLHFGKMQKTNFISSASIVFDKNEPVYTNRSVGKFKKGISPGIILGYGRALGSKEADAGKNSYTIGATLSQFHPHTKYFQWELYLQHYEAYDRLLSRVLNRDTSINGTVYKMNYRDIIARTKVLSIEAVPIEFRYNLSSFFSAGTGVAVSGEISRVTSNILKAELVQPATGATSTVTAEGGKRTESFAAWRVAPFIDIQFGRVRTGPLAGVRLLQYTNPSQLRLFFYAAWKF